MSVKGNGHIIGSKGEFVPPKPSAEIVWKPMPGKIVVEVPQDQEKFSGGILFRPQTMKVPRTTGRVIAIYEPFLHDDGTEGVPYVAVGDLIIFGAFSGSVVEYNNKRVVIIKEAEILTKIEAAPEILGNIHATHDAVD